MRVPSGPRCGAHLAEHKLWSLLEKLAGNELSMTCAADEGLARLRESRNQEGQRDLDERCTPLMVSFGVPS